MHAQLAEQLVASVRARVSQGDHPTEPALSVENLEDLVITLADRIVAADTKGLTYDEAKALGRDDGVDFVFDHLAKALGLKQWSVHDGSETWDGDVHATLMGILRDSGAIDPETDIPAVSRIEELQELADGLEKHADAETMRADLASLPAPEPVAWEWAYADDPFYWNLSRGKVDGPGKISRPLYASPPSHQGLREALERIASGQFHYQEVGYPHPSVEIARAALQSQPATSGETK